MKYAVVIEKARSNYSAYVPDLPGCVATGSAIEEIELHIEGMRQDGERVPEPSSSVEYIEVAQKFHTHLSLLIGTRGLQQ